MEANPEIIIVDGEHNEDVHAASAGAEQADAANNEEQEPFSKRKRKKTSVTWKHFCEATKIISGSEYPTSNLFLSELYGIKEALDEVTLDEDDCMKGMANEMKKKFDKYWGSCNMLISIGVVMDPRYKMVLVNFSFKAIYSKEKADEEIKLVQHNLEELFKEYVEAYKEPSVGSSRNANIGSGPSGKSSGSTFITSRFGKGIKTGSAKYDQHIRSVDCVESVKSELVTYLEEGVIIPEPGVEGMEVEETKYQKGLFCQEK
ncbi:hypothetical protein L1987_63295 [Smallanthus sonchifolius]|uniref:Uncharacterized protein n=1 Tax=Smallanthus sonchifolius TaxID=185202 RepID=A0ACB9CCT1_9ASTR|nr:hypothetical protein L1987_63295 [Smallanthus sonchifolius]